MRTRAVPILLSLLAIAAADAQPVNPELGIDGNRQPLHQIDLPASMYAAGLALSNDGKSAYVRVSDRAIHVPALLLYFWPEWFGAILGIALLVLLLGWRRIARTPRIPGEAHCRKCNYCLRGASNQRCPECGNAIVRPIIGRTPLRRILPRAIPAALLLAGYAAAWIAGAPRGSPSVMQWNGWSFELEAAALRVGISLKQFSCTVDCIKEFDTRAGAFTRNLTTVFGVATPDGRLVATPDGRGLVTTRDLGQQLVVIDLQSGDSMASISLPDANSPAAARWIDVVGFDAADGAIFAVALDSAGRYTSLVRWSPRDGQMKELVRTEAYFASAGATRFPRPHRFVALPGLNPVRFIELDDSGVLDGANVPTELLVRERSDPSVVAVRDRYQMWGFAVPISMSDGIHFLLDTKTDVLSGLRKLDATTLLPDRFVQLPGHSLTSMQSASFPCPWRFVLSANSYSRSSSRHSLAVFDTLDGAPIAVLAMPSTGFVSRGMAISANGKWVAVNVARPDPKATNSFIQSLVLYRLPDFAEK